MLFIKPRQIHIYRGLMMDLNSSSTKAVSIENYEIQIFIYDFKHIHVYLCRVSFLRILDIYKNYFKVRKRWCNLMKSHCACKLWPKTEFTLIHHILSKSYCDFASRVSWLTPATWRRCWLQSSSLHQQWRSGSSLVTKSLV